MLLEGRRELEAYKSHTRGGRIVVKVGGKEIASTTQEEAIELAKLLKEAVR